MNTISTTTEAFVNIDGELESITRVKIRQFQDQFLTAIFDLGRRIDLSAVSCLHADDLESVGAVLPTSALGRIVDRIANRDSVTILVGANPQFAQLRIRRTTGERKDKTVAL